MEFVTIAVSPIFDRLFGSLAILVSQELGYLFRGVKGEAKKLKDVLQGIQLLLRDAEERQIKDQCVRLWLSKLEDAAYDAEDILGKLEYRILRIKLEAQTRTQTQVAYFFSWSSNCNLGHRIKEIRKRLEEIKSESNHFNPIVMCMPERLTPMATEQRTPTTSIVDESTVFGRETDREKMVGLLLTSDCSASSARNGTQVIPICGMGGLGKTTLAQLVYNDEQVKKHFDERAWVHVSEVLDLIRLSKEILESLTGRPCMLMNLDTIQVGIMEALKEKRFLLVLDDVWNVNYIVWDDLRALLKSGARGSSILVTTRSLSLSRKMGTVPTHFLRGLSDVACWSLFELRAFVEGNSDAHPDLKKIGKEILKKCRGSPLAVKTLGGLLRTTVKVGDWKTILESEIWHLPQGKDDILPALRLSYHHLPSDLKRCFTYLCLFSKGSHFIGDELVSLWMAQGFIESKGREPMEDIGREYLDDLVSRSLLDEFGDWGYSHSMHDLTHDLALSVSGDEFFVQVDGKSHGNVEKARHVSYIYHTKSFNFEDLYCSKSMRTLLLQVVQQEACTNKIPADLFRNLRDVRVLAFNSIGITELLESIGKLIHLRHLDLTRTNIERLPKSTTRLYNLQTLLLDYCCHLVELPSDLTKLVNLKLLSLQGCSVSIPPRIGRLTTLKIIGGVFISVEKMSGYKINEIKDMIHIVGSVCISKLENVGDVQEAREADLKKKQKIHSLKLEWKSDDIILRQEGIDGEVLKGLQPHTNLKELEIAGYCGGTFPRWLADSSFSNIVKVKLCKCSCRQLPSFGQLPALGSLYLSELYGLKKVGHEFYGNCAVKVFPSLQKLTISSMPDLEEWSGVERYLGHVAEITISKCSKLKEFALFPITSEAVTTANCERPATLSRVSANGYLTLSECDGEILSSLQYLSSLSSLNISKFPNLTSLPSGLLQPHIPLKNLKITDCDQLMSLSEEVGLQHLTSLHSLEISRCPQLTTLGDEALPTSLRRLRISKCDNLTCLPIGLQNLTSLDELRLDGCPKIQSLPEELPTTLQSLSITNFALLVSLSGGLQHLTSLQSLEISWCPQLTSLGDEALPTSIRSLQIEKCDNLNCLPIGLQNLTSLVELRLDGCSKIQSLPEELPTTLELLFIGKFSQLMSLSGKFQLLSSLHRLEINECPHLTSLGDEALPSSLEGLRISKCNNLNSLPTGLQNLTSLDELTLDGCPKIHSLPEEIPTTLQTLDISKCPLLEEKCEVGGEYWCKISHIPYIRIGGIWVSRK